MILVDMGQVIISNLLAQTKGNISNVDPDLLRHMILNSLRSYNLKFRQEYGPMVLCYDASNGWRRDIFPNYKQVRRESKKDNKADWDKIFEAFAQIRTELQENFPYKILYLEKTEADDCIAVIAKQYGDTEPVLVISGDKDFQQLQVYRNVVQYDPRKRSFIRCKDPVRYLSEHIIRGDSGDGVPNIRSDDDTFVNEAKRQTPIRQSQIDDWVRRDPEAVLTTKELRNYDRNRAMIDFGYIPENIQEAILAEFRKPITHNGKQQIMDYMMKNRMRLLLEKIGDF